LKEEITVKNVSQYALLFIAACAVSTGAMAQRVYRCGNTYSHIPCPDAVTIDPADARSIAQKEETDKANARNAATATAMEKTRLKIEAQGWASQKADAVKIKNQTLKLKEPTDTQKVSDKKRDAALFTASTSAAPKKTSAAKTTTLPAN
jgi:hypothetical protein